MFLFQELTDLLGDQDFVWNLGSKTNLICFLFLIKENSCFCGSVFLLLVNVVLELLKTKWCIIQPESWKSLGSKPETCTIWEIVQIRSCPNLSRPVQEDESCLKGYSVCRIYVFSCCHLTNGCFFDTSMFSTKRRHIIFEKITACLFSRDYLFPSVFPYVDF